MRERKKERDIVRERKKDRNIGRETLIKGIGEPK